VWLVAGKHKVRVEAVGCDGAEAEVLVIAGEGVRHVLDPCPARPAVAPKPAEVKPPEPPKPAAVPADPKPADRPSVPPAGLGAQGPAADATLAPRTLGWVAGGTGLALAAGGAVLALLAVSDAQTLRDDWSAYKIDEATYDQKRKSADTKHTVGLVLTGVGAVGLVGGAVLLLGPWSGRARSPSGASLDVHIGPNGGLSVSGRF
jgi:hypothetical protein